MSRLSRNNRRKRNIKLNYQRLAILIILILIVIGGSTLGIKALFGNTKGNNVSKNQEALESTSLVDKAPTELTLTAAGDVMAHKPQLNAQYDAPTDSYSFDNNYTHIKKYIEGSDLAIANLETTLAGKDKGYDSYPTFNTPDSIAKALKNAGFDLLSTINNHSLDKGDLGVNRTLEVLKELELDTIGTYANDSSDNYIIKDINDIKLGITAFSYGEIKNDTKYLNGIQASNETKNRLSVFDMTNVENAFNTIMSAVNNIKNTDMQIVIIHWGNEYQRNPSEFQTTLAQKLCDAGVDIIIGSHPHVVQPVEMITSSDNSNETVVIYSLGNFISNQRREYSGSSFTEDGLLVNINITKNPKDKEATIKEVSCIPTWVNKYTSPNSTYEIIPIADKNGLKNIENVSIETLKKSFNDTTSLIKTSDIIKYPDKVFE